MLAGCGPAARPSDTPGTFEVEAAGAPAVVDRQWTLDSQGQGIGVVLSAVPCGDRLFLSDQYGGIRRLNLRTGVTEPTIAEGVLAMSLAADCNAGVLYAFGPARPTAGRRRGNQLVGFDMVTGELAAEWYLNTLMMPASLGRVVGRRFVVGGLWMPMTDDYRQPPAPEFYHDKKIGLAVDVSSGEWSTPVAPFDLQCRGGGRCVGGSLQPLEDGKQWLAVQPASPLVALYDSDFRLTRTIDISSPLFRNDGRSVEVTDAEASMRWSANNSLVRVAMPMGETIATIHSLVRLPDDYVFGQSVEFDWWLNLHSFDGRGLVSDISIPGWPIGWEDGYVYAVDYGPNGRQSAPDSLKVMRMPVRPGRDGFSR